MTALPRQRPWLDVLKNLEQRGAKSAETTNTTNASPRFVGSVGETSDNDRREIAWRVAAMRSQIPPRGPIRFLLARPDLVTPCGPGHCDSCGDAMPPEGRYRCTLCKEAAWLVINEVREGVPRES
jgi:hypothetical protein